MEAGQDTGFVSLIKAAYVKSGGKDWQMKNSFYLERGPFVIAAVMDENVDTSAMVVKEAVIDLFDPELPVVRGKVIKPGEQGYMYSLRRMPKKAAVLVAAARVTEVRNVGRSLRFKATGPLLTNNVMRVAVPGKPVRVEVNVEAAQVWDEGSKTLLLKFKNSPDGVNVEIGY